MAVTSLTAEQAEALEAARAAGREGAAATARAYAASQRRQDAIAAAHHSGLSMRRIARELDISHTAVQAALSAWNNRRGAQNEQGEEPAVP